MTQELEKLKEWIGQKESDIDYVTVPAVHRLGSVLGLVLNIRRANLEEDRGGWVIVEVEGTEDAIAAAIAWLADQGLQVDRISA